LGRPTRPALLPEGNFELTPREKESTFQPHDFTASLNFLHPVLIILGPEKTLPSRLCVKLKANESPFAIPVGVSPGFTNPAGIRNLFVFLWISSSGRLPVRAEAPHRREEGSQTPALGQYPPGAMEGPTTGVMEGRGSRGWIGAASVSSAVLFGAGFSPYRGQEGPQGLELLPCAAEPKQTATPGCRRPGWFDRAGRARPEPGRLRHGMPQPAFFFPSARGACPRPVCRRLGFRS